MGWKMAGSWRFWRKVTVSGERVSMREIKRTVMRRVFDGGDGLIKGGIDERSRDSGVCVPLDAGLEDCETGGEVLPFDMIVAAKLGMLEDYLIFSFVTVLSLLRSKLHS